VSAPRSELTGRLFELTIVLGELIEIGLAERQLSRARATLIASLEREGPMMQRELSQLLGVTPRNVTGLVDALEAAALVARQPHPGDRRATLVTLTASGKRLATRLRADEERFGEILFGDMPRQELETLLGALDHLLSRLHAMRASAQAAA
jgi:DNA-binding MarR family transcriptional regulator